MDVGFSYFLIFYRKRDKRILIELVIQKLAKSSWNIPAFDCKIK